MVARQSYVNVPPAGAANDRDVALHINQMLEGRLNIGRDLTVLESETFPFDIVDRLVSQQSVILIMPMNQDALDANFMVTAVTNGQFTIDQDADTDQDAWTSANIRYVVIG
jgi:hypothetical protein